MSRLAAKKHGREEVTTRGREREKQKAGGEEGGSLGNGGQLLHHPPSLSPWQAREHGERTFSDVGSALLHFRTFNCAAYEYACCAAATLFSE